MNNSNLTGTAVAIPTGTTSVYLNNDINYSTNVFAKFAQVVPVTMLALSSINPIGIVGKPINSFFGINETVASKYLYSYDFEPNNLNLLNITFKGYKESDELNKTINDYFDFSIYL